MNHDTIKELEQKETALTVQTIEGARTGAVSPSIHRELAEIRAKLKTARRVRAMDAKRTGPKLTRKVSFLLPEYEYQELLRKADGKELSKYIRDILKIAT